MLHAVIMAGGVGARFWPLSRRNRPKQLIDLTGEGTMLEQTMLRLDGLVGRDNVWIVTNADQAALIREIMPDFRQDRFIIEPLGRNTAPAIGLAAVHLHKQDPDAVMIVLPADHRITNLEQFHFCLHSAVEVVHDSELLATIGIEPTRRDGLWLHSDGHKRHSPARQCLSGQDVCRETELGHGPAVPAKRRVFVE
ncbi:MAG: NTP transferase domain-containing protein [bacterium]|nr:NTP transferase domain-containing protein [bacterium]